MGDSSHMSLGELLLSRARQYGKRVAMVCSVTGKSYSYSQLALDAQHLKQGLHRLGVKKGDVVTLVCHNCPEVTVFSVVTLLTGAIISPANPALTIGELKRQLIDNESKYVFCSESVAGNVKSAAIATSVQMIIVLGESSGCISYKLLMNAKSMPEQPVHINPREDIAFLPYSSGTTGLPKGVMLSHYNLIANIKQFSDPLIQTESRDVEQEVYIAALPLFHVFGFLSIQFYGLYKGHKIVYMPRFSLTTYLQVIQKYKATILHMVPPIVLMILQQEELTCDFSSVHLAYAGAATLSSDTERAFLQKTGIRDFKQGLGMTEAGVLCATPAGERNKGKGGSVGVPVPHTEVKVVDEKGGEVTAANVSGELCFRGPQIMIGYWKNPEASQKTVDDEGWLHTGDVGFCDKDGFIHVTGRLKELIKYNAYQVVPAELESVLLSHPDIQDAAVVGLPDRMAGELPYAFIVKKPDAKITHQAIIDFVKDKVAPYKELRGGVSIVASIPKSPSGKILRRILKDNLLKSKL